MVLFSPPFLPSSLQAARVLRLLRLVRLFALMKVVRRLYTFEGLRFSNPTVLVGACVAQNRCSIRKGLTGSVIDFRNMGGFRMRKSMRIAPGVRLNVSKRGVGASVGAGGLRYSAHSSGRRTVSARTGIPGVYYQKSVSGAGRRGSSRQAQTDTVSDSLRKPGLFSPRGEKKLFKAIKGEDADAIKAVGDEHPDYQLPAFALAGLMLANDRPKEATQLLETAFASGLDPAEHRFMQEYVPALVEIKITEGVSAQLPINRDAVGLTLAELYQAEEDLERAIGTVEQLEPTTYSAVSLAELYGQADRNEDLIELTDGVTNEEDSSALLLVFRAVAFRKQGFYDAAHESFKEALRARSRSPVIRHHALFERAQNHRAQGKVAAARKDLERILAEDSDYEGVREQLAELAS